MPPDTGPHAQGNPGATAGAYRYRPLWEENLIRSETELREMVFKEALSRHTAKEQDHITALMARVQTQCGRELRNELEDAITDLGGELEHAAAVMAPHLRSVFSEHCPEEATQALLAVMETHVATRETFMVPAHAYRGPGSLYSGAVQRLDSTPELEPYRDVILDERARDNWAWVAIASLSQIVAWAEGRVTRFAPAEP